MSKIDPKDSRQGKKGQPVLIVLIAAMALAVVAFVGMGIYGGTQPDENIGGVEESGVSTEPAAPSGTSEANTTVAPADTPASPSPAPSN